MDAKFLGWNVLESNPVIVLGGINRRWLWTSAPNKNSMLRHSMPRRSRILVMLRRGTMRKARQCECQGLELKFRILKFGGSGGGLAYRVRVVRVETLA